MSNPKRIAIVEDDSLFRSKLMELLNEVGILVAFKNAEEFLRDENPPFNLAFVDVGLPGMNGVELVAILAQNQPDLKIVMLTAMDSEETIFRCIKAGAVGYLHKTDLSNLVDVARTVLEGGGVMSPSIAIRVMNSFKADRSGTLEIPLTARERQVLDQLVNGYAAREIADLFKTAEDTVRSQIKSIYRKLQVNSRVQLVRKAIDLGFL